MTYSARWPATLALVLTLLGILSPATLLGQADRQLTCRAVLRAIDSTKAGPRASCTSLAAFLSDTVTDSLFVTRQAADTALQLTPRKLQSTRSGEANISGVPGQAETAPTAQPSPLASATLSGAGTDAGTKAIAAISINPVTLFGGADTVAAATWSRFTDLTVLVPVGGNSGSPGRLGYFGIRGRVNFTGLNAGDRLLEDVSAAFARAVGAQAELTLQLKRALETLPDSAAVAKCAAAVIASTYGDSPKQCLGKVTIGLGHEVYDTLRHAVALAREKADARYFGLDLRFDTGDPTLAQDPAKEVTALQAGFAFGRRSLKPNLHAVSLGLQTRLGVRYSDPKTVGDSVVWSLDGALGFEASRIMSNDQPVRFSTGLEFRYANKPDAVAELNQTDYLVVRGGLAIPLIGGTSVAIGFTGPLTGEVSPDLSVKFNWGLLMPSLAGAGVK